MLVSAHQFPEPGYLPTWSGSAGPKLVDIPHHDRYRSQETSDIIISSPRLDAVVPFGSVYFQQALQSVASRTYDKKYVPTKAREFFPTISDVHRGAETYRFYQFQRGGNARLVKSYAAAIPPLTLNAVNFDQPVRGIVEMFDYSIIEVEQMALAAQNGQPNTLDAKRAENARYNVELLIDKLTRTGSSADGLNGALNNPNIPISSVSGFTGNWAALNPPADSGKIIFDITSAAAAVVNSTKQIEYVDTLLLPVNQYSILVNSLVSTAGTKTIYEHILDSSPWLKNIQPWFALSGAGAGSTDRMMFYRRDPDALGIVVPWEFEMRSPQETKLVWEVYCHARYGGLVTYYPLSATYVDGI